ncbi:P-loop containing nucleoside triphosphate hydrolase [Arabidopsis suecica]|uniref:P-loop containing nucleoside triphosphate hydrolase n=1 Tax=Arabidopsis suecica TaxID=45249 RepID=A0A8T1ZT36_ARASU|nr:P-loop containing nucleoside triphosphate hydrolase [Arabidopsis suecica]
MRERLKNRKVLICIDDLDDQLVLDALVGQTHWFGCGSRIIVITKDKHFLRAHEIDHIYEVRLPSEEAALEMLCRYAFKQKYPPDGFLELASEGTKNVLGISLDIDEIDEVHIHENAFKGMRNLFFLKFFTKRQKKEIRWHLSKGFDHFPPKLRLLSWERYPLRCMPSNFHPENLVKLEMRWSKLEKLWDGVHPVTGLKEINLWGSKNLIEIPNLSMATNLEKLVLNDCSSLVEVPSSIQYLDKLYDFQMERCENLEILPTGINLQSLYDLNLMGCSRLKRFPNISSNISTLDLYGTTIEEFPSNLHLENLVNLRMCEMRSGKLWEREQMLSPSLTRIYLSNIPTLVELPSSIQNLHKLEELSIWNCKNLETLPTGINLKSLYSLDLSGCSQLRSFPDISTNISELFLNETAIEEVPWWIENFSNLSFISMSECKNLKYVSLNISKLKHLEMVDFSDCGELSEVILNNSPSSVTNNTHFPVCIKFINCFKVDQEALLMEQSGFFEFSCDEVPSYFTHQTIGASLINVPLLHISPCQPFFIFRACALVDSESIFIDRPSKFQVCCRFIDSLGNHFDPPNQHHVFSAYKKASHMVIFECSFPLNDDNAPLAELKYDHVDIQFQLTHKNCQLKLKGCGIRFFEDDESSDDNETEYSEECSYSDDKYLGNETDYSEKWEDCDDSDLSSEIEQWKDCEFRSSSSMVGQAVQSVGDGPLSPAVMSELEVRVRFRFLVAWSGIGFSGSVVYGFDLFREKSFWSAPSLASGLWEESLTLVMSLVPSWSSNEGPFVIAGAWRWCWCCRIPPFSEFQSVSF